MEEKGKFIDGLAERSKNAGLQRRKPIPMSEMEAVDQMQLSAHDNFFVFYNADKAAINILYKRNDGTYGVIEPEIA